MNANENSNKNRKQKVEVRNQAMNSGSLEGRKEKVRRLGEKEWMRMAVEKVAAEDWWAKCPPGLRVLAMTIATMMEEMTETKRIEIRREAKEVRVRFIHLLKQPEKGCLSAILLPEPSGRGWN